MKAGDSFTKGEYTAVLTDIARNWDGDIYAILFTIYKNGVQDDIITVNYGQRTEFADGRYRLYCYRYRYGQVFCSLEEAALPNFIISSTTKQYETYNKTTVCAKLTTAAANHIKVNWETSGVDLTKKPSSKNYETLSKNTNITNTILNWSGNGSILIKISYKDSDGNDYKQTHDIIQNTVYTKIASGVSTERITAEKKVFKNAAIRAMKYGNLSSSSSSDLRSITSSGKVSKITVTKYRENIEKKRLAAAITRSVNYISYSEADKTKLNRILLEIGVPQ